MIKRMIKKILNKKGFYEIDDLVSGGWCGVCGKWYKKEIVLKEYRYFLCDKCLKRYTN